jgi:hypothetical protein
LRRGSAAAAGAIGAILATGLGVPAQNAAPDVTSIAGRVVAAATGRPVPGARVTARMADTLRSGTTDVNGRFSIATGTSRYVVLASAPGYLRAEFGEVPGLGGTPVAVTAGRPVRDLEIALHRGGTIAGRVIDDRKEPVIAASVRAFGRRAAAAGGGDPRLVAIARTETDDRGVFRLIGLPSDDYVVGVVDRASVTFAPAAMTLKDARRIVLAQNAVQEDVDVRVRPAGSGAIEGLVTGPGAAGSPALSVELVPDPNDVGLPSTSARPQPGGRFAFTDVAAGRYLLIVRPGSAPGQPRAWAREGIVVTDASTSLRTVTLHEGARISGTVTGFRPSGARVELAPVGGEHPEASRATAIADGDGAFTFTSVSPGRYRWVQYQQLGQHVLSAFRGDEDITDRPLAVSAGETIENLRLTITEAGRIRGVVRDAHGRPTTAGAVVIASVERPRWTSVSQRLRAVRPDTEGAFEVQVPAGRYFVSHVAGLAEGQLWDAAFLATLAGAAEVTVTSGRAADVQLRVGPPLQ